MNRYVTVKIKIHELDEVLNIDSFKKSFLNKRRESQKVVADISKTLRTTILDTSINTHSL